MRSLSKNCEVPFSYRGGALNIEIGLLPKRFIDYPSDYASNLQRAQTGRPHWGILPYWHWRQSLLRGGRGKCLKKTFQA
jgi:hypothetical protein